MTVAEVVAEVVTAEVVNREKHGCDSWRPCHKDITDKRTDLYRMMENKLYHVFCQHEFPIVIGINSALNTCGIDVASLPKCWHCVLSTETVFASDTKALTRTRIRMVISMLVGSRTANGW